MTEPAAPGIIDFTATQPQTTVSHPPADRLLGGRPQHITRNFFSDATGQFFAGVWESTPGRWQVRYTENEFCHITRGSVRIEDASGRHWTFKSGDSFVVQAGFSGVWDIKEPTAKVYAIFESAAK